MKQVNEPGNQYIHNDARELVFFIKMTYEGDGNIVVTTIYKDKNLL